MRRASSTSILFSFSAIAVLTVAGATSGCGDADATGGAGATSGLTAGQPISVTQGAPSSQTGTGNGGTTTSSASSGMPATSCAPLPPPQGTVVELTTSDDLVAAFDAATSGTTLSLADGTYTVPEAGLWIRESGVTVRSASGNRDAVILDGNYQQVSGGVINVSGVSDVTIAELTIRRARYHTIHVSANAMPANGVRIYRVHLVDPGEQAVKVNNEGMGAFTDNGELACSLLELTSDGRDQVMSYMPAGLGCYTGGIDAHGSRDWVVRDNVIRGFWCGNAFLSEHGIHFWRGSRDTIIERNLLEDNARAIGLGLDDGGRTYDDDPCGIGAASHYGGLVRNNMIVATDPDLFASPSGMDGGIALAWACDATVVHNTIASTSPPFASIEWRFASTTANIVNNLATHDLVPRDGATATLVGNIELAAVTEFVDLQAHDAHLDPASNAIGAGDPSGKMLAPTDFDGQARGDTPDVGADEVP